MDYYVYVLMDSSKEGNYVYGSYKFSYEPFYIGKGRGKRIIDTIYDKSSFKYNKINKLKNNNIEIKKDIIFDSLTNEEAILYEKELIKLIGRRDLNEGVLVNLTDGGDGRINSKHSDETKNKISNTKKSMNLKFKHSEETINKMKESQSGINNGFHGKNHTKESKEKISIKNSGTNHSMYNKKHSEETIEKLKKHRATISNEKIKESCQVFNKSVSMYDLKMSYIETFESVKQASLKTGINESLISKCCRGEIFNPTRYFFKYNSPESKFKKNKFLITDTFNYCHKTYKIIKRNKKNCVCSYIDENKNEVLETLRYADVPILIEKDTNNSGFAEMYIFLSNYGKFKKDEKNYIIYNKDIKIYYNKLHKSSELFLKKKDIFDRHDENVINIFEDQWEDVEKKDIIKSRLLNFINKTPIKIYARKCVVKQIDSKEKRDFLIENHIQGDLRSKYNFGLYYNQELVSIMTFGSLRKNLGQTSKEGYFELLRFCNKKYCNNVGGASKLFKAFIKEVKPLFVLSYSDRNWGKSTLYKKLNFVKSEKKVIPNYFYIINYKRKNRFGYRKDLLVSQGYDKNSTEHLIMQNRNFFRIYDCGSDRWEFHAKQ